MKWIGRLLEGFAKSSFLGTLAASLVGINMILMMCQYEGMSDEYSDRLESYTTILTNLFIIEMVIKIIGLGFQNYWTDGWNALDGSITLLAVAEIISRQLLATTDLVQPSFLRVLRLLRIVRMLRLMKAWKGLYKIITSLGRAIPQMGNLFVMMFLMITIFALLGMQTLGGIYNPLNGYSSVGDCHPPNCIPQQWCPNGPCPDNLPTTDLEEKPHYHFDYFGPAMLTVFVIFTGEWWDAATHANTVLGAKVLLYFVPTVIIGRYLVLNLFVGILLNAFNDDEDNKEQGAEESKAPASPALTAVSASPPSAVAAAARPHPSSTPSLLPPPLTSSRY